MLGTAGYHQSCGLLVCDCYWMLMQIVRTSTLVRRAYEGIGHPELKRW